MASSANPKLRHGGCHWILLFLLLLCSCYCTDAGSSLKFLGEHPFEAFASRSSEKGKILYRLFAIDSQTGDSDGITYALLESNSSSSLFSMNPTTGEIILTSQFPSLQGYLLTVEARASSTGAAESVQITVAVVTELQATRARFEHESYEIQISESTPVNREFSLIGAFSLSTRNSEYVESYSLAGGTSGNIFSIDPSSGILTVMKPLDRERTTDYFLIIEFSYGTRSIYTQVHVVLLDANDNAPRFEGVVYDVSFPENTPVSSTILQISATDPDLGTNGDVLYGLNIFGEGQFSLNSQSGVIVLSRPLDFERVSEYRFSVTAMDQGMPSLTSTVIVTVHVENMADECPIFQNSIFTSYHQAGTTGTLLQVLATDPDELSDIAYSIVSATGEGSSSVAINPETGIVSRENNDLGTTGQYFLNVSARDDNCSMKSFVPVEIRLDSTENFPPQLQGGCEANMTENPLLGTEVIVLMATDDDGGFYGRLTYSLTDSSYFVIDSSTGTVSTVRNPGSYDRESDPVLRVGALVRDGGLLQDYCLLTVYLMDVNDNVPVFATPSYTASVGSNSPANAFVSNVSAYDADSGPNGNISYSFSIPSNLFSMDSTTGVVTTSQSPLAPGSYALIVIASDSGSPVLTSSTTLTINVLAGSTNFPVFEQMYYNATICETVFSSSAILIVEASDSPVYSIIRGTTYDFNSGETLRLQGNTLTRGSNQIVNFELLRSRKSFLFLIKALNIRGSNFATVEVFVEDTDDNAPQLIGAQSFNLAENLPVETVVSQIMATDLDSGLFGQVVYELSVPSIYFNISADGTIRSTYVFDFERPGEMLSGILQVRAYNPNQAVINNQLDSDCPPTSEQSSSFAVFWRILDQNDEPPRFTQSAYSYDVPENSSIGTTVLNFDASDSDEGDGSSLSYSIANGNIGGAFSIEGGMLILRTRLDARRVPVYTLSVDVTDGVNFGSSCLQCSASFTINITEPANPPPSFTRSFYEADLMENAPVWTTVLTVTAADPNSDSIRYSLSANVQDILNVSSTGVITVTGNLDRESYPHGVLSFMAFAEEEGRRGGVEGGGISSAAVNLTLLDVNDCPPRFQQVYTGMVEENLALGPGGILVAQVLAVDLDEGRNGMVTYQLETGMEHGFRIDPVSGNITATAVYDREEQSLYRLRVLAVDEGVPMALSSTTVVTVEIGDVDDNSPFFPFPYMYVRLFETDSAGSHVFQVPAVDLDVGSNAAITYILDSSSLNRFSLNETTGEIVTTGSLDYEIPAHRRSQLNISIRGQESIGQVEVILLDRNDNRPRLDQTIYYDPNLGPDHVIYENIAPGPVWAVVSATDDDEGTNGELVFSLRGGDGDFQINEQGEVNTTQFLDFETRQSYNLTVEIKDGGVPANSLSVELDFIVGDVNDNAPSFESSIYQLTVTENSTSMPNILQVRATDPDSGPGGVVDSYRIASGNTNDTFSLNSTTGVLGVRASLDREAIDSYVLVVSASDQGPTPLTGTAVVRVTVGDVDDNPTMGNGVMDIYLYGLDGMFANRTLAPVYFNDPDISNTFTDCNTLATSSQIFTVSVSSCLFILNGFSPPPGSYIFEAFLGNNIHDNSVIRTNVFYINSADAQDANSVTITINATVEDFFDQRLNSTLFPIIAEKLGVGSSGFNLLSIQSGYHDNDNTLDVTFSARTPQSGVLLSSPEIVSLLYLTRDDLVIGNHGVVSIPTDPCVAEPCSNQARCHATREFGGPELAISTRQAVLYAPKVTLGYQCDCVPGTAGPHCEVNYDDCYSNPCQYGVPCTDAVQGFICDCPPGTFGSDCSFNPDECSASNPCENGATCVNEFNRYICTCQPGYYGNECQYSYFEPSSLCEPSPCLNNGNCSAGRDSFTCQCPSGFDGPLCENPVFLQGGCVGNPCYHGSACTNTDLGPRCTCSVGFSGPFCRWPLSSCELELCQNGATCEDGFYGSYRCTCPPDYTGANCDVRIPACASGPCGNGGRCVDDSDGISFTCQCPPSFAGSRCQVNLLLPTDHCIEAPCSGNCTSGRSGYTCTCSEGFRGDDCTQVAENSTACSSNPCQHGGTCTSQQQGGVAGYMCDCSLGYTGENCEVEIDDCDGIDPCLNRGICVDTIGGHYCDCPPGVTGGACQIHCPAGREGTFCREVVQYCNNSSCLNGGTCDEATGGFRCTCPVAFTGSTCEIPNTCQSSTCRNGGTCISVEGGGSKCNCPEGFDGANCELLSVSFSGGSSTSSYRAFHTLDHQGQGSISLDFATTQQDGLLLYSSQYQDGQSLDFIAAEIVDGFVRVSMSQGSGQRGVVLTSESVRVSDGRWHRVSIERSGKMFTVLLDECHQLEEGVLALSLCQQSSSTPGNNRSLDLGLPLWIGGAPFSSPSRFASLGFAGCVRNLTIDDQLLDLEAYLDQQNSARGCGQLESGCGSNEGSVCGGGACIPRIGAYSCICPPQRTGDNCEKRASSVMFSEQSYIQYRLNDHSSSSPSQKRKRQASDNDVRSTLTDHFSFRFRTDQDVNGTLFLIGAPPGRSGASNDRAYVEITSGGLLVYHIDLGSGEEVITLPPRTDSGDVSVPSGGWNDAEWHFFESTRTSLNLTLTLDNITQSRTLGGSQLYLDVMRTDVYVGGTPNADSFYAGCMEDARIDRFSLPTSGSNDFASVKFISGGEAGSSVTMGCSLRGCRSAPCGSGTCSELGESDFLCHCPSGTTVRSETCPGPVQTRRYQLVIIVSAIAGALVVIFLISMLVLGCWRVIYNIRHPKYSFSVNAYPPPSDMILSNRHYEPPNQRDEEPDGAGEEDTAMTGEKLLKHVEAREVKTEDQNSDTDSRSTIDKPIVVDEDSPEFFVNPNTIHISNGAPKHFAAHDVPQKKESHSPRRRATSPVISAFIDQRLEHFNNMHSEYNQVTQFSHEGSGSSPALSLRSRCSYLPEEEPYTVEDLKNAGPLFAKFQAILEILELEEENVAEDLESERVHTGQTQTQTQTEAGNFSQSQGPLFY